MYYTPPNHFVNKDLGQVWGRLFDHRPFLSGEIKFFLREFEEKRKDCEVDNLFCSLESVTEVQETYLPQLVADLQILLADFSTAVSVAETCCQHILDRGDTTFQDTQQLKNRSERSNYWNCFMRETSEQCEAIDSQFIKRQEELKQYYKDLETKLKMNN